MDPDRIKRWLAPMCSGEKYATIENSGINKEWEPILKGCVPNPALKGTQFGIPSRKCFFFTGPAGTGKHRAAVCFAGSLKKAAGFDCFHVRNSVLDMADKQDIVELVDGFMETARSDGNNMFCLIENPSKSENTKLFLNMLMEEMEYSNTTMKLVVVVCDTNTSAYREEWQDMMMLCQFALPNRLERENYFKITASPKLKFNNGFGEVYLSERTDKLNYNQLKQIVDLLRMKVQQRALETYDMGDGVINVSKMRDELAKGFFTVTAEEIDWAILQVQKNKEMITQEQKSSVYNAVPAGTNIYAGLQAIPGMYVPQTSNYSAISAVPNVSTEVVGEVRNYSEEDLALFE